MELLLVRHGLPLRVEGADGPADPTLSPVGHDQARSLAEWLAFERIDGLYASPMRRALETAAPLLQAIDAELVIVDGLAEFDRHASSYVPMEELRAAGDPRYQQLLEGGYFDEGELTAEQFQAAVVDAVEGIIAAHPGGTAVAVCHGGVINAYLAHVLGLAEVIFFEPEYTSVSRVRASSRGHRSIGSMNETGHLVGRRI